MKEGSSISRRLWGAAEEEGGALVASAIQSGFYRSGSSSRGRARLAGAEISPGFVKIVVLAISFFFSLPPLSFFLFFVYFFF